MSNHDSFKDSSNAWHLVLALVVFVGIALLTPILKLITLFAA
ncbi:hypothetical protein A28LD_2231 [Idiomarina sp. A28L]|nr:hypothetical protein [Idiomarina sp. A28L]EGN74433.1 hypothetical protein A28LD_2231 [Idiomarina sp. A28L]